MILSDNIIKYEPNEKNIKTDNKIPDISILSTKFTDKNNNFFYVCGKFTFNYLIEKEHWKDKIIKQNFSNSGCIFYDKNGAGRGGCPPECRLYKKFLERARDISDTDSYHNYAYCCKECIDIINENNETVKIFNTLPFYIQNIKNTDFNTKEIEYPNKDYYVFLQLKENTKILEKEMDQIFEEVYGVDSLEKKKEFENQNVRLISNRIDMIKLSNGDFFVERLKFINQPSTIMVSPEIDEYVEKYIKNFGVS